jgi:anti-anti-sigma factor
MTDAMALGRGPRIPSPGPPGTLPTDRKREFAIDRHLDEQGRLVVGAGGEADVFSAQVELQEIVAEAVTTGRTLIFDLRGVEVLDLHAIEVLAVAARALGANGAAVVVRNASASVEHTMRLSGLDDRLRIERFSPARAAGDEPRADADSSAAAE